MVTIITPRIKERLESCVPQNTCAVSETPWTTAQRQSTKIQSTADLNLVLTIQDIMDILHIGRNSAYSLVASGELKAFRCGKQIRITRESLEAYLAQTCHI